MNSREVHLSYSLAAGWLAPYVEALYQGRALARACRSCRHASFPPLYSCGCPSPAPYWQDLSGRADILFRTDGLDGHFALARFASSTTMAVVRLVGLSDDDHEGKLIAPIDGSPALLLGPIDPGSAE
jgi:uncharacterized OB-fold protein